MNFLEFIKWFLIAILGVFLLYISARVVGAGWFKSKKEYVLTQRRALQELLTKSTKKE